MLAEGSGPPVLLLHGSGPGTTAAAWEPLIEALAPTHRVIAPDFFGFGGIADQHEHLLLRHWTSLLTFYVRT
jgi:pimeloyl-ACP methyl ester carboxylesterase